MKYLKKEYADFLKFRDRQFDIEALEKKHQFCLPPIFRSFIVNFEGIHGDVILYNLSEVRQLTYYSYELAGGEDVLFEDFMEIENMFKYRHNSDSWIEGGLVPITLHSHGGTILLGTKTENADKLFYEHDNGVVLIEESIFCFLRNLKFVYIQDVDFEGVFKKFGEFFWRLDKK